MRRIDSASAVASQRRVLEPLGGPSRSNSSSWASATAGNPPAGSDAALSPYSVPVSEWVLRRWREGHILLNGKTFDEHVRDEQLKTAVNRTADPDDGCRLAVAD